jgi:hypothetical protein
MGTTPRVCFLGGMGGKSLVDSQGRKVGLKKKFKELFFWWCGVGRLEKGGGSIFIFFLSFVTW